LKKLTRERILYIMSKKTQQAIVKTDLAQNWAKAKNYIPALGVFIIYEYDDGPAKIKIGNGKDYVNDLHFIGGEEVVQYEPSVTKNGNLKL